MCFFCQVVKFGTKLYHYLENVFDWATLVKNYNPRETELKRELRAGVFCCLVNQSGRVLQPLQSFCSCLNRFFLLQSCSAVGESCDISATIHALLKVELSSNILNHNSDSSSLDSSDYIFWIQPWTLPFVTLTGTNIKIWDYITVETP